MGEGMITTEHHWSGWPGAYCFHCGHHDPMEQAIGDNWYDPYTRIWDTEEHREIVEEANICITTKDRLKRDICPQCQEERKHE